MINIIRQGDEQKPKRVYRFHCSTCGCIWETDEYKLIGRWRGLEPAADCPNCGNRDVTMCIAEIIEMVNDEIRVDYSVEPPVLKIGKAVANEGY